MNFNKKKKNVSSSGCSFINTFVNAKELFFVREIRFFFRCTFKDAREKYKFSEKDIKIYTVHVVINR